MDRRNVAILDLQYGSTGKGLIAGYLAQNDIKPTVGVCAFGPNAGHTYINAHGKFIHIMLPMSVFSPACDSLMFGPGSIIDVATLTKELEFVIKHSPFGRNLELYIHPNAVVWCPHYADREVLGLNSRIGSTLKGTGAAAIEKTTRDPSQRVVFGQYYRSSSSIPGMRDLCKLANVIIDHDAYIDRLHVARVVDDVVMVEGAQGYSLSLHSRFYPYCTSRDVSFAQLMADCLIPRRLADTLHVVGSIRTYPIRVNNRNGSSGSCYPDQHEISWSDIGQEPELTTVTQLPRRLFTFSMQQLREAVFVNGVDDLFLNFCNYIDKEYELIELLNSIANYTMPVRWQGWGPAEWDVDEKL